MYPHRWTRIRGNIVCIKCGQPITYGKQEPCKDVPIQSGYRSEVPNIPKNTKEKNNES